MLVWYNKSVVFVYLKDKVDFLKNIFWHLGEENRNLILKSRKRGKWIAEESTISCRLTQPVFVETLYQISILHKEDKHWVICTHNSDREKRADI